MLDNKSISNLSKFCKQIDNEKIHIDKNFLPLIEKYRPKKFNDIILNSVIKNKISSIIDNNSFPNIIIAGPSGTGKTSLILTLAKKMLGDSYREGVMSLNASDNRGLDIINNTIIYFCKKRLVDKNGKTIPKIVIMDEADNITKKAQNMISNLIEQFSDHTRFAFTCNESNKLIESIQSRCLMIYISPLKSSIIYEQLKKISEIEDIKYEKNGLEMISNNCKGDLRLAINLLDAINNGFEEITCENIKKMYYQPDPKKILKLIQDCAARNLNKSIKAIDELKMEGYCGTDIFLAMINIVKEVSIDEDVRIKYISIISDFYTKVSDGLDTKLQLYGCVSKMILLE